MQEKMMGVADAVCLLSTPCVSRAVFIAATGRWDADKREIPPPGWWAWAWQFLHDTVDASRHGSRWSAGVACGYANELNQLKDTGPAECLSMLAMTRPADGMGSTLFYLLVLRLALHLSVDSESVRVALEGDEHEAT